MKLALPVVAPFSFEQTLAFLGRFPPCRGDYTLTADSLTAAVALGGRAHTFTVRGGAKRRPPNHDPGARVTLEVADGAPQAIATIAGNLIGAGDDLGAFYEAAAGDAAFAPIARELHGLHHVRFMTLADIAVYAVMMQRTPMTMAAAYRRRFVDRFGLAGETGLRAVPELAAVAELTGAEIGEAIGHRRKGELIASVVRGVAALGEEFLVTAPYEQARDALLEIPHVGPFSAAAILLRGLGRMDELPMLGQFEEQARAVYGIVDLDDLRRRYGRSIGYWSFYLMTADRAGLRRRRAA